MWILMLKNKRKQVYDFEIGADPGNNPDVPIDKGEFDHTQFQ